MAQNNRPYQGADIPKAKINAQSLKRIIRLFNFMQGYKWLFFLGTFFLMVSASTSLIFPKLTGDLINASSISKEQINKIGIGFVILFIVQAIASYLRIWTFVKATEFMTWNLRNVLFKKIISMPISYFHNNRVGEILSRFGSDITQIQETFVSFLATFIRQILVAIGGMVMLFYSSPELTFFMLSIIPPVVIVSLFFGKFIRKISKKIQDETAVSSTVLEESFSGIQVVKSFANELFEVVRYNSSTEKIRKMSVNRGIYRGIFSSFIILCLFGGLILVAWRALHLQTAGLLAFGDIIQFMLYTLFVGASIGGISEQYAQIQKSVGAADRILDILEMEEEIDLSPTAEIKQKIEGEVTLDSVEFAYPSRPEVTVLKKINVHIKAGEKLAVLGASGAGKSTLVQLILQFYTPQSGHILFDGKEASLFQLNDLRRQIGLVPQDISLFGASIYDNIRYGNPNASEEEIIEAAKQANAHDFIVGFPEAYATQVGDRGVKLSGGQRQRIAIARIFLKKPSILILDEATSSLDSESELLVQDALEKLMKNRTSIIIAHRLSTIKNTDNLMVLKHGQIVEYGNPSELLKNQNSVFFEMWNLQFGEK